MSKVIVFDCANFACRQYNAPPQIHTSIWHVDIKTNWIVWELYIFEGASHSHPDAYIQIYLYTYIYYKNKITVDSRCSWWNVIISELKIVEKRQSMEKYVNDYYYCCSSKFQAIPYYFKLFLLLFYILYDDFYSLSIIIIIVIISQW